MNLFNKIIFLITFTSITSLAFWAPKELYLAEAEELMSSGVIVGDAMLVDEPSMHKRGYQPRACGFDLDGDGVIGERNGDNQALWDDCNVCDGVTLDPDKDGVNEDLIYVSASNPVGNDSTGNGTPGKPYRTIRHAVSQADGPSDGAEDIICINGVFSTEGEELVMKSGIANSVDEFAARERGPSHINEVYAFEYPANPFMIVGWDKDNDGCYAPFDNGSSQAIAEGCSATQDVAVLDGGPQNLRRAFIRTGKPNYVELAHFTVRDYGSDVTGNRQGFMAFQGGGPTSHIYIHDLFLDSINKGIEHNSFNIIFNFSGAQQMKYIAIENLECKDCGGYLQRYGGFQVSAPSEYFRTKNTTMTQYSCRASSTLDNCNVSGIKQWNGIQKIEVLDNMWNANVAKADGSLNWGPNNKSGNVAVVPNCSSQDWYIVNNEFIDYGAGVILQPDSGGFCGDRPMNNVNVLGNIFRAPNIELSAKSRTAVAVQPSEEGETKNEIVQNLTIANNVIEYGGSGYKEAIFINSGYDSGTCNQFGGGQIKVVNNTIKGKAQGSAIKIGKSSDLRNCMHNNVLVKNNIIAKLGSGDSNLQVDYTPSNFTVSHNVYDPNGSNKSLGSSNQLCHPSFINNNIGESHLASSDNCARGKGTNLSSIIRKDIDGETRPSSGSWDIGADEYCDPATEDCFEIPDPVNQAPNVDVGANLNIVLEENQVVSTSLSGFVTDDGLPNPPGALTYLWEKTSGPNSASIINPTSAMTNIIISEPGTYDVKLTASDGELSSFDSLRMIAVLDSGDVQSPVVTINQPTNGLNTTEASMQVVGTVTDDSSIAETRCNGQLISIDNAGRFNCQVGLSLGENNIVVAARDVAGNEGSDNVMVIRDSDSVPSDQTVTRFTLVNAKTDTIVGELKHNDVVNIEQLGTNELSVIAHTSPEQVGSVRFALSSPGRATINHNENKKAYTLLGDDNVSGGVDYRSWNAVNGVYTLTATPFSSSNQGGFQGQHKTIVFTVGDVSVPPMCGDGNVDDNETCDDGNTVAGDGCDERCQIEDNEPVCGNNIVEGSEQCDDGNTISGDGCDQFCREENNPPLPGVNILSNGDFEDGKVDWGGWSQRKQLADDCGNESCKDGQSVYFDIGGRNLKLTHKIVDGIVPGKIYNISADLKVVNAQRDVYVEIFWKKKGGGTIGTPIKLGNIKGTLSWENYSTGNLVAPSGAAKLKIRVTALRGKGGKAYIDNVVVNQLQ